MDDDSPPPPEPDWHEQRQELLLRAIREALSLIDQQEIKAAREELAIGLKTYFEMEFNPEGKDWRE